MDAANARTHRQAVHTDAHRLPSTLLGDLQSVSLQLTVAIGQADRAKSPLVCPLLLAKQHVAQAVRILTEAEAQCPNP